MPIKIRRPGDTTSPTTPAPPPPTTSTTAAPGKPPRITRTTPFRQVGTLSAERFGEILKGSPMAPEAPNIHSAVRGQMLPLAQSFKESQYGKTASGKNPLGLMQSDGRTLMTFVIWSAAFAEWDRRMTDVTYKGGIYMPLDMPLERYIRIYVAGPGPGYANGETAESVELYLQQTIARLNRYLGYDDPDPTWTNTTSAPTPSGDVTFGQVPKPSWKDRQIPDALNIAWDTLGQRQLRGIVYHRQDGTNWGTDGWFRTMWYVDKQGVTQKGGGQLGLTDFGVDHTTGELLQWNDYRGQGREGISPNRSGWASGPWQNPPGDGRAYVQKFGVNAINRDLVSIEIAGYADSPIAAAGIDAIVNLSAYLADQAKVPWAEYPHNPHTGLVFTYWHSEFQNFKTCPGDVVRAATEDIIARTKARLREYQT